MCVEDSAILGKKHCPTVVLYRINQVLDVIPCLYLPDDGSCQLRVDYCLRK